MDIKYERDLTVREAAELLAIHPDDVRKLARMGRFPHAYKSGAGRNTSPIRIPYPDIEAYRRAQPRVHG